jgi:hypothetical protein
MALMPGRYVDDYSTPAPSIYNGPSASDAPGPVGTASAPTPTPPPAAPAGSVQVSPGFTPDWSNLIQNDSGYLAAKAAADKAKNDAAAQRKQALQQAIIQYGGLPSGFADQYGDIDQATLDSAQQNQFSTLAQLAKGYAQNEEALRRGLAARGALQSGDLNYGEDQLQNAYGQQRYDAANAIGSQANQVYGAYTGVLNGNAQSLASALQGAESAIYSNPGFAPVAAQTANYDASNSATYGQPIYVDSQGNLFDQNGNPFSPSGPSASSAPSAPAPTDTTSVYFNPSAGQSQDYRPAYGTWAY